MAKTQDITRIDERVYIVAGKVIEFQPEPYDMSDQENIRRITDLAKHLYEEPFFSRLYGDQTITVLLHDGQDATKLTPSQAHVDDLREGIREKVKEAMGWR